EPVRAAKAGRTHPSRDDVMRFTRVSRSLRSETRFASGRRPRSVRRLADPHQHDVPPLRRLFRYARHERGRLWAAFGCSVLNKIFDLAPPVLIGTAVDIVVQREDSMLADLGVVDLGAQLWVLAIATLVIWTLESAFEYVAKTLWRNLAQSMQHG